MITFLKGGQLLVRVMFVQGSLLVIDAEPVLLHSQKSGIVANEAYWCYESQSKYLR